MVRNLHKNIKVWLVNVALVGTFGCSDLITDIRDTDFADDDVIPPQIVTGAQLTIANAQIRCGYSSTEIDKSTFAIDCQAVVALPNGSEIAASSLEEGLNIAWQAPKVLSGELEEVRCEDAKAGFLAQKCIVKTKTPSAKIDFSLQLQKGKEKRTASDQVLLPYSVQVAMGLVPSLPTLQSKLVDKDDKALSDIIGFQRLEFPLSELPAPREYCFIGDKMMTFTDGHIYLVEGDKARHFAGSPLLNHSGTNSPFELDLYGGSDLICENDGVEIFVGNKSPEGGLGELVSIKLDGSFSRRPSPWEERAKNADDSIKGNFEYDSKVHSIFHIDSNGQRQSKLKFGEFELDLSNVSSVIQIKENLIYFMYGFYSNIPRFNSKIYRFDAEYGIRLWFSADGSGFVKPKFTVEESNLIALQGYKNGKLYFSSHDLYWLSENDGERIGQGYVKEEDFSLGLRKSRLRSVGQLSFSPQGDLVRTNIPFHILIKADAEPVIYDTRKHAEVENNEFTEKNLIKKILRSENLPSSEYPMDGMNLYRTLPGKGEELALVFRFNWDTWKVIQPVGEYAYLGDRLVQHGLGPAHTDKAGNLYFIDSDVYNEMESSYVLGGYPCNWGVTKVKVLTVGGLVRTIATLDTENGLCAVRQLVSGPNDEMLLVHGNRISRIDSSQDFTQFSLTKIFESSELIDKVVSRTDNKLLIVERTKNPVNRNGIYLVRETEKILLLDLSKKQDDGSFVSLNLFSKDNSSLSCGSGKVEGQEKKSKVLRSLLSSLASMCIGNIEAMVMKDNCKEKNGTFSLGIGQSFKDGYNILRIDGPCVDK